MRGFTSAFIILATVTACGTQYDEKQPHFARESATQNAESETPGSGAEPVYMASSYDFSQDPVRMEAQDLDALTQAMQDGPDGRSFAYAPAPDIQQKLAACNLSANALSSQKEEAIDIRNYTFNVTRLQRSRIAIHGSGAEIVFINVAAERRIARVDLSLNNPKATYCLNIEAGRVINRLQITHACQAKLGVVNIEAGVRARNIAISGNCL